VLFGLGFDTATEVAVWRFARIEERWSAHAVPRGADEAGSA
jgi:high-affinity nickel permease